MQEEEFEDLVRSFESAVSLHTSIDDARQIPGPPAERWHKLKKEVDELRTKLLEAYRSAINPPTTHYYERTN